MKARLIEEIGTKAYLRIYWKGSCISPYSFHNAMKYLKISGKIGNHKLGGQVKDHKNREWPSHCDHCGSEVPKKRAHLQVFTESLFNTDSGKPEPGDLYYVDHLPEDMYWDNHTGPMLHAIVPSGEGWNIDSRASNCGLPDNRVHRCWVKHGEPPNMTIDKNGETCKAGQGSIETKNYHGFLTNGEFRLT